MTNPTSEQLPQAQAKPRGALLSLIVPALVFVGISAVGAFLAGQTGLQPLFEPLLLDPKVSAWGLMMLGLYLVAFMMVGTFVTAKNGEMLGAQWSFIWTPLLLAGAAVFVIPFDNKPSLLAEALLWCLRLGAGL